MTNNDRALLHEVRATLGELSSLSAPQRILVATDGTVTHVLEALADEPITLVKLSQSHDLAAADDPQLGITQGEAVIRRRVLLQGSVTGTNHLYADSVIMADRLHPRLSHDLVHTNEPIGRLLALCRIETFRELVSWRVERAGDVAVHFGLDPGDEVISRTYSMHSQRQPIMVITEKFPRSAFEGR